MGCVCGSCNDQVVYEGPIRDGRFGRLTESNFKVLRCTSCGVDRLDPLPADAAAYESGRYRESVDGTKALNDYYDNHDSEVAGRLELIGSAGIRGRAVMDVGCGAGAFLDVVKGMSARTIGIEPHRELGSALVAKG